MTAIILIIIKLFIFSGFLFVFGWQLARFVLKERRVEVLIPLAAVLGPVVYLFLLNLSSYLVPIRLNFYLLAVVLAFFCYFLYRLNAKIGNTEWGIEKKWRIILFATCFMIMLILGMVVVRYVSNDELGLDHHLPLASTMAGGNFPVKAIFAPDFLAKTHYGFNLFMAAISEISGLPIWFASDFLISLYIGVLFLLGFLIVRHFCQDNFRAYLSSLIMIFGGSLDFFYFIRGLPVLYQKYVLNLPIEAPFKFLDYMLRGTRPAFSFVIGQSEYSWVAFGFALTAAIVYLYFRAINDKENCLKISLLAGIIFSFLALTSELFFGALGAALLVYLLIFRSSAIIKTSLLILSLGFVTASFQGGFLTQTIKQTFFGYGATLDYSFSVNAGYLLRGLALEEQGAFLPIFSLTFFLRWGWLFIFVIPVAVYFLKRYFRPGLFLMLLTFIPFFLPLIADFGLQHGNFTRINYLTNLFWNLSFGLFLGELFLFFRKRWQRILIVILILAVVFQGLLYSVLFPVFPNLMRNQPFFKRTFSQPTLLESKAFEWIKKHTAARDYFLTFGEEVDPTQYNAKFVLYAKRSAPTFYYDADTADALPVFEAMRNQKALAKEVALYERVIRECDVAAIKALNYRYLYVNQYWPQGLEAKCLNQTGLDLQLKFGETGSNEVARIYLIK